MKHKVFIALFVINALMICDLYAQDTTTLPTSMYGIGELSSTDGGLYSGLGRVGTALNVNDYINTLNPAAITRLDSIYFRYNVGSIVSYSNYSLYSHHSSSLSGTLSRVTMAVRLKPRWYAILGVAPFSSVGYSIVESSEVEGNSGSSISSTFDGSGGLYKIFITNAFKITDNLSAGISAGVIRGTVYQSESQESATVERESQKNSYYVEGGLHYIRSVGKNRSVSIGLTYMPTLFLNQDNTLTYSNSSTSDDYEADFSDDVKRIPQLVRLGLGYKQPHWTFLADYAWQNWNIVKSSVSIINYENQHQVNLGAIYKLNERNPQSAELMGGAELSNSYVVIKKQEMQNLSLNFGIAAPFKGTVLSFGFTWKKQLNSNHAVMKENRFSFNLGINFKEKIFKGHIE